MEEFKIEIAKDFNDKLGGRWKRLGPHSGEAFYDEHLKPKYEKAFESKAKLHVYLDGTKGYGSSFLDQSFGELARNFGKENVKSTLEFHSNFFRWVVDYIANDIWEKG